VSIVVRSSVSTVVDASLLGGLGCLGEQAVPVGRARTVGLGGTVGAVFLRPLSACTASRERFVGMQATDGREV